jgi:two-component system chemotaxis response regulator CheB
MTDGRKVRVLIVDDSALVRKVLTDSLAHEPDIEVVGTAPDPLVAMEKIARLKPDVLTLDVEMPRMDGLTFLKRLMRDSPLAVIMISSVAQQSSRVAIEAMAEGAVEVLAKPDGPYSVGEFRFSLARKVRNAAAASIRRPARDVPAVSSASLPAAPAAQSAGTVRMIAIGASTGGTEAIERIFRQLPAAMPAIVVVQHIPAGFSKAFADRLNTFCKIHVREAVDGEFAVPGTALVAPGNFHLRVRRVGAQYRVSVSDGLLVCYQRPAVDVLFESVAESGGADTIGVLLTGMGADGAQGLRRMRSAGAHTIAQDEASCVVFGMPKEAIRAGAVSEILPLDRIAARLTGLAGTRAPAAPVARRPSSISALNTR